jgi:peroxiredoxin
VIEEGKLAPSFSLATDTGEEVSLESFRGQPVVLYSYAGDDSLGAIRRNAGRVPRGDV